MVIQYCSQCNTRLLEGVSFCLHCGKTVEVTSTGRLDYGGNSRTEQSKTEEPRVEIPDDQPSVVTGRDGDQGLRLAAKLKAHQDKLLRVGFKSRSVLLRKIIKNSAFDLLALNGGTVISQKVIHTALRGSGKVLLISDYDDDIKTQINRRHLVTLARSVKHIEEETGLREFFLGWPFLEGHLSQEEYVRAPILLFPFDLYRSKDGHSRSGWHLEYRKGEPPLLNRALIATIGKLTNFQVSETLGADIEELWLSLQESAIEKRAGSRLMAVFVQQLSELLAKRGLPVDPMPGQPVISDSKENLQQGSAYTEHGTGAISGFPLVDLTNEKLAALGQQKLHLVDNRVIGIFQQGSAAIYNDFSELIEKAKIGLVNQGIIDNLLEVPSQEDQELEGSPSDYLNEEIELDSVPDEKLNTVKPSDASQDCVLIAALQRECTVVRGPPGTGKSQLIVNMIADNLHRGKNVMLVCQKKAALDVVYKRLEDVGLSDFTILLHHAQTDRAEMYSKLSGLLQNNSSSHLMHDSLASEIVQVSRNIDYLIGELLRLTRPLHQEYFFSVDGEKRYGGITLHTLHALLPPQYRPELGIPPQISSSLSYPVLQNFLRLIPPIESLSKRFDYPNHPWFRRKSFGTLGLMDRDLLSRAIDDLLAILENKAYLMCATDAYFDRYLKATNDILHFQVTLDSSMRSLESIARRSCLDIRDKITSSSLNIGQVSINDGLVYVEKSLESIDILVGSALRSKAGDSAPIHPDLLLSKISKLVSELASIENRRKESLASQMQEFVLTKDFVLVASDDEQFRAGIKNQVLELNDNKIVQIAPSHQSDGPRLTRDPKNGGSSNACLVCILPLPSSYSGMQFAIKQVISGFDAASGFGKGRYETALRLRILERVAQMAENGDKDARKALKMDGLFSKFKRTSTSEKAIQAAQDIGQCDIVGLDAALSKIVAARQRPIVDVVVGWKDLPSGGDAGENYKEPSEFANILDIFVHINKEFFDADTIYILEKTSTEGTAEEHELLITSVASILCASLKKPKLVSIVDHQLLEKLEQSGNAKIQTILGNPERSVVIRDQMFQEEIKILEKMQNVISTQYSPEIKASVRTLLEYLERNHESLPPSLREVQTKLETGRNLAQLLEKINRYLSEPLSWNTNETSLLEQQLHRLKEGLSDFDLIQELDKQKDWLSSTQREILSLCIRKLGDKSNWSEIVRNDIFYNWIAWIEERNPEVKGSPFERYNQLRSQLMDLVDKKRILLARKLTMQLANNVYELKTRSQIDVKSGRRPKNFDHTNYSYGKIVNNFADELSKKRRVKPVRKLMQEYGSLVMKVGPCWLASPEVVSEVLPLERGLFDLIIVDEASQCAVERILPALYRGSRIVIVGDDKQLPPFDLFRLKEDESEYESELEQDETLKTESLLALAHRTYGEYYLTWHYRSKYQELIDFSNHAFYNGTLHIAPSLRTKSDDPPIKWVSCNGVWDERANREEASKVVDEIKSIWQKWGRKYSVGVITFNDKQRETIEDEIDSRMQNDPEFEQLYYNYSGENAHNEEETGNVNETAAGPIRTRRRKVSIQNDMRSPHTQQTMDDDNNEKLFVKNIENVQGHERDIIVFSIAYAKDTEGRPFRHHFGTLNSEGGENILNVAITRARLEVRIVCSIDPERDLHTDTLRNKGPKLFKRYLMYAKAIAENNSKLASAILDDLNPGFLKRKNRGMQANDTVIHTESIFEDQVLDALIARGYQVEPQLGYSDYRIDLAIRNPDDPDRFILAVECDGTTFHSAKSIRERDIARQRFLEQMGWKVERIWSRNWWHDPQRELKRIEQRIEELRKLPPSKIQPD